MNFITNPTVVNTFLIIIGVIYYAILLTFTSHYMPLVQSWSKKNRELLQSGIWFSALILGFVLFYRYVNSEIALEILGGGVFLYILKKGVDSFNIWKGKKKPKKKETKKLTEF